MKKLLTILAVLLMAASVFAGGKQEAAAGGEVSMWTAYPETGKAYEELAQEYMEANPAVDVKVTVYAARALEDKCNTSIPSGVGPDVLEQDIPSIKLLVENGHFAKPPERIWDFYQTSIRDQFKLWETEEEFWGLPSHVGMAHVFWNKEWFSEVGLSRAPETIDEMVQYARKLVKYDANGEVEKSGISLRLSGGGFGVAEKWWIVALAPYGGSPQIETAPGKYMAGFDTEAARRSLKLYIDLLYKHRVDSYAVDHDSPAFAKGVTAMFQREGTVVPFMEENAPDLDYGIAPMWGAEWRGSIVGLETLEVTSMSKNPELAWDFVLFLSEPDSVRRKFMVSGRLPVRGDIDYGPVYAEKPKYEQLNVFPEDYGVYTYFQNSAFMEIWAKAGNWLTDAYTRKELLDNPEGIRKTCADFNKQANDILREAGQYAER